MGEGAGEPGLAGAGLASKDDLLAGLDPVALREREDLTPVEPPAGGEIDVFDAGVGKAHLRVAEPVGEALVSAGRGFAVEHEAQPFIALERLTRILSGQGLPGVCHACQAERGHLVEGGMCQHLFVLSMVTGSSRGHGYCRGPAWR